MTLSITLAWGQENKVPVGKFIDCGDKRYLVLAFEKDKWIGWDKVTHFVCGYALESGFELTGMKRNYALFTTIALSVLYEWYDMERGVGFSYKDATWAIGGAVLSYFVNKKILRR